MHVTFSIRYRLTVSHVLYLPYFWQRDYDVAGQIGLEPSIDGYVRSVCDTMDEIKRVLSRDGVLFLNPGDTYYSAKGKPQGHDPKHNGRRLKILRAVDTSGLGVPQKTLIGIPWRVALFRRHGDGLKFLSI